MNGRSPFLLIVGALLLQGQTLPCPDPQNPRIQTLQYDDTGYYQLLALPMTGLTVVLERGERITRAAISDDRAFELVVSGAADSFLVTPRAEGAAGEIFLQTDRREYRFLVRSQDSLLAAYVVRFEAPDQDTASSDVPLTAVPSQTWSYRFQGDSEVTPASVVDDGAKTRILFPEGQDLPAIFGIGPVGEEQAVNGYMRGDAFVIDRVYSELVFRIDKERATAKRSSAPDTSND